MFTKERANQLLHTMMELKLNTELEETVAKELLDAGFKPCLLYTSPSPRDTR